MLGGTGLIGSAVARRLLASGWQVDLTGRDPTRLPPDVATAGGRFVAARRDSPPELAAVVGAGPDLLVDCLCFTARDAAALLPLAGAAGSTVMISSKAVYVDEAGRHSNSESPPCFDGPITETQPTMAPGDGDFTTRAGYGANKVAAEQILLDSGAPVTVLRPSKVHGRGAARPREWVFVKRALDRRPVVLLARGGVGVDHPTAAVNIAELVAVAAASPGRRVLNAADPDAPDGREIARTVARQLGHRWSEVPVDPGSGLGWHPWDARHPITLDMTAAAALGYRPVGDYATTVADEVDWLASAALPGPSGVRLPPGCDERFFAAAFDYAAEDRYLAG